MDTEELLRIPGFDERLFEYVRTLPPEHNVAIARMDFSMLNPSLRQRLEDRHFDISEPTGGSTWLGDFKHSEFEPCISGHL